MLEQRRENVRLLPGVPIPAEVRLTADIGAALDAAELIITAIPTVHLRNLEPINRNLRVRRS